MKLILAADLLNTVASFAPMDSPLIFTMIMEMLIRKLEPRGKAQGKGFGLDRFFVSCVCYADDILLAATSMEHMEDMFADVVAELKGIGLGVGPDNTYWTSTPP